MAENNKPFHCPTFLESFLATAAEWPRGRAWPVNDGGTTPTGFLTWLAGLTGVPTSWPAGFVQAGYTAAIASVYNYFEQRMCALRLEFWCQTQSETNDQWLIEYGLPDPCDPFPDLCTKVAAIGGTRCEYYQQIAARMGWVIDCEQIINDCGAVVGCTYVGSDDAQTGPEGVGATIQINVYLDDSPAFQAVLDTQPYVGNFDVGHQLACAPDISALGCVLERVVHAHVRINYQTITSAIDAGVIPFPSKSFSNPVRAVPSYVAVTSQRSQKRGGVAVP